MSGCQQAASPTAVASLPGRGANQVTATLSGIVLDGFGNPLKGVTVKWDDGANTAIASKSILTTTTDTNGYYEIQMMNETYQGGTAIDLVYDAGSGYVQLRLATSVPSIQAIRAAYGANLKPNTTVTINSGVAGASTTVANVTTDTYSGFHVAQGLAKAYLFKLEGEVTGVMALKHDLADSASSIPPTGSLVAFNLPTSYSPSVIWAKTDATGKFVFSASGSSATPNGASNALPVFAANTGSVAFPATYAPSLSIQASGGTTATVNDTAGLKLYTVVLPSLTFVPPLGSDGRSTNLGTLFAVADTTARIVSWTPVTFFDGLSGSTATAKMSPTVGATTAVTPLTITFSKAIDDTKAPVSGITLSGSAGQSAVTVAATSLTVGTTYTIVFAGTSVFTGVGAINNSVGTTFVASGTTAGGTGVVSTLQAGGGITYSLVAPTLAWSTDKLTATITPAYPFAMGDYVKLSISNWTAADGSAVSAVINSTQNVGTTSGGTSLYFAIADGIKYTGKNSFTDNYNNAVLQPVAGPISIYFNVLPVQWDTTKTQLYSDSALTTVIPGAVTAVSDTTGNYLKFVPTASLALNTSYYLQYSKVSDGTINDQTVSGSFASANVIKTVMGAQLATPVPAVDTIGKSTASGRTAYNGAENTIYLTWPTVAGADTYTITSRIKGTVAFGTSATVNSANGTLTGGNWTFAYTSVAWVSGQQVEIQMVASDSTNASPSSLASALVTVGDTVAPVGGVAGFSAATSVVGLVNNTGVYQPAVLKYTVSLPGGTEKMSLPVLAAGGTLSTAFGTVSFSLNLALTTATITLTVPNNVDATGKTVVLTLADAAGNVYNSSLITVAVPVTTQTLTF